MRMLPLAGTTRANALTHATLGRTFKRGTRYPQGKTYVPVGCGIPKALQATGFFFGVSVPRGGRASFFVASIGRGVPGGIDKRKECDGHEA